MKPARPIFSLSFLVSSNQKAIKNFYNFSFSTLIQHNPISNDQLQRQREERRSVQVSVWWDFENCNLPSNTNVFRVTQCITNALRVNGIKGPIRITAFGDVMQISRTNQEALSSTGINLTHVPSGGKNSADRSLLVDLMFWVSQNPPPAHLFLISGDRDFAGILHRLRMNNYNILLASPDSAPSVLCSAATIMWQWSSLLKGENIGGKLFNQPPDGPYSWYGHYKVPLEDPFEVVEQPSCLPPAEEVSELTSDSKVRPIPKSVVKYIRHILNSNPEGISITQLRAMLAKNRLFDKDLYGYKKFSRFLLGMPDVLKLQPGNDGQFFVHGVNSQFVDESVPSASLASVTNGSGLDVGDVQKAIGESSIIVSQVSEPRGQAELMNLHEPHKEGKQSDVSPPANIQDIKVKADDTNFQFPKGAQIRSWRNGCSPPMSAEDISVKTHDTNLQEHKKEQKGNDSSPDRNIQEIGEPNKKLKLQLQPGKDEAASSLGEISDIPEMNENQSPANNNDGGSSKVGIFRRIWMKWFGSGNTHSGEENSHKVNGKVAGAGARGPTEYLSPASFSPSSHEALINGEIYRDASGDTVITAAGHDSSLEKNYERVDNPKDTSKEAEGLSKESLWREIESFIGTYSGSALVSHSRTRKQLVQNLQKQGPAVVRSLPEDDLISLVDDLITNKKWLEECDLRTYPFKVTRFTGRDPVTNHSLSSNGLSHFFKGRQENLRDSGEKKHQNPPHTGVTHSSSSRSSGSKPRSEILADCQKLVDQIVKEYPEGFNMGCFRKVFLERYGYALDLQKLGYEKLVNLLQIMSGMRIESTLILPAGPFKSLGLLNADNPTQEIKKKRGESSSLSSQDEDSDDSWDELGPVNKKGETVARFSKNGKKVEVEQTLVDYEPLEEGDFSESDEETSNRLENRTKSKSSKDYSSLLQILDSWPGMREDGSKKGKYDVSDSSDVGSKDESVDGSPTLKQKHGKTYSFVAEPVDGNSKSIDNILGCMKTNVGQSAESKVLG